MSRSARMIGKPASEVLARHPCVDLGFGGTGKTARPNKSDAARAGSPALWVSGDQPLGSGKKSVQGASASIYACAPVGSTRHPSPVYRAAASFGGYSPRIGEFAWFLPQRPGRPNDRRHSAAAQSGANQCRPTAARPIHMCKQSGNSKSAPLLLSVRPKGDRKKAAWSHLFPRVFDAKLPIVHTADLLDWATQDGAGSGVGRERRVHRTIC